MILKPSITLTRYDNGLPVIIVIDDIIDMARLSMRVMKSTKRGNEYPIRERTRIETAKLIILVLETPSEVMELIKVVLNPQGITVNDPSQE